ncbi:MAG: hypothetical protein WBQ79_08050 [Acidobacteriaceae bacterium]
MILLAAPLTTPAVAQQSAPTQQTGVTPPPEPVPQDSGSQSGRSASQPANANQQPAQAPQQGGTPPVGTAVAPYEKGVGVAASRPAGVVIAPAKQRRTRSFLIQVGLIVGAAVAVGTVIGLSNASPSRPH